MTGIFTKSGGVVRQAASVPGSMGFQWKGAWVSGTNYIVNDMVTSLNIVYRRKTVGAGATAPASDATNWEVALSFDMSNVVQLTGTQSINGAKTFLAQPAISIPAAANDTRQLLLVASAGTDGTLGPNSIYLGSYPSATGGNRFGFIYTGDSLAVRPLILNTTGTGVFGRVGMYTTAPTHAFTMGSAGDGYTHYNTTDQVTNFERVRQYWSSNVYNITTEAGGTGTARAINLVAQGGQLYVGSAGIIARRDGTSSTQPLLDVTSTAMTATAGNQVGLLIDPTINQSGTAGYLGLSINITETAVGSGAKRLMSMSVGGVTKAHFDNTGRLLFSPNLTTDTILSTSTSGDTASRFVITGTGSHTWGPGNASTDTTLSRVGVGTLQVTGAAFNVSSGLTSASATENSLYLGVNVNQSGTAGYRAFYLNVTETAVGSGLKRLVDIGVGGNSRFIVGNVGTVRVNTAASADPAFTTFVDGDASSRFSVTTAGVVTWGTGAAVDTNLYRSAADTLKTDDAFQALTVSEGATRVYSPNNKPTPADIGAEPAIRTTNTQTGAYTLVLTDATKEIELNSASNFTLTIPTNASVAFPIGTRIPLRNINTGDVTIAGAGGVTVNAAGGALKLIDQWAVAEIEKTATDTWLAYGRLSV